MASPSTGPPPPKRQRPRRRRTSPSNGPHPLPPPSLARTLALLALLHALAAASQAALTPSHGGVPAAQGAARALPAAFLAALLARAALFLWAGSLPPLLHPRPQLLPLAVAAVPPLQLALAPLAHWTGPVWGAAAAQGVILALPLLLGVDAVWRRVVSRLGGWSGRNGLELALLAVPTAVCTALEGRVESLVAPLVGTSVLFTRLGFLLALTVAAGALFPSRLLWLAALPVLHTIFFNPHSQAPTVTLVRDAVLAKAGFALVVRQESVTGYVSVLENRVQGFRVLRCDHSLLGGQWMPGVGTWPGGAGSTAKQGPVGEPIYTVFVLLEAVRLVYGLGPPDGTATPPPEAPVVPDAEASALVIGLGIGTTPSALAAHGVRTTVLELDPAVTRLARAHFALHPSMTVLTADALVHVAAAAAQPLPPRYTYIIHDVFTGGAEPAALFTLAFLRALRALLADDGVLALNYASDLRLPSAALVLRTALAVFPACRLFREDAPPVDPDPAAADFANTVLFCRKRAGRFDFRPPREADFLRSGAREMALRPEWEVDLAALTAGAADVLTPDQIPRLERWGRSGAVGHWHLMRTVLPNAVWETW